LVEGQAITAVQPKKLSCNFRAPDMQKYQRWKAYVQWAKDNGMDVCHFTLSLTDTFMKGTESTAKVRNGKQVVNIQPNNILQYQVSKPRREPYDVTYAKREYQKTRRTKRSNNQQAREKPQSKTNRSLQQTHNHDQRFTKDLRTHIPNNRPEHRNKVLQLEKESCSKHGKPKNHEDHPGNLPTFRRYMTLPSNQKHSPSQETLRPQED